MNSLEWMDASSACELLQIKPQTLYSYVSRKLVRVQADTGDARRSLYARSDIEALVWRSHRPRSRAEIAERAIRWGDPVLATQISEVRDGMLWLRGRSVEDCADNLTFEDMAAYLWNVKAADFPMVDIVSSGPASAQDSLGRALQYLACLVSEATSLQQMLPIDIVREGRVLMSGVTNALLGQNATGPMHLRLCHAWKVGAEGYEELRRVLVLLSDHELNPSTFSVRIAASTGASLPAALLSGIATLSGPRHGRAAILARSALQATLNGDMNSFLATQNRHSPYHYGFGHPLYPEGDPRARLILERIAPDAAPLIAIRALSCELELIPNIDCALAALSMVHKLPEEAPLTIFATARLAGWIAHAMEQVESAEIIRPRARYTG